MKWMAAPLLLACSLAGWAGEWTVTPRLDLAEAYTDNVELAAPGAEEHEFITQVVPGLLVERAGQRLNAGLDYQMENLFFARESSRDSRFHRLDARVRAEMLSDLLYLDATAGHIQSVISTADAIPLDNLTVSGNRTDTTTWSVAPYFQRRTAGGLETLLRYEFNAADYDESTLPDMRTRRVNGHVADLDGASAWGWQLSAAQVEYDAEQGPDSTLRRSELELRYQFSARLQLLAIGGYEDNEYELPAGAEPPRGVSWSAGLAWNPSARTLLRVTAGRRFFGRTATASLSHRTRRAEWEASYTEELETGSDLLVQNQVGAPLGDPFAAAGSFQVTPELFLGKRAALERRAGAGRSEFGLGIFNERREYVASGEVDRSAGVNADWNWNFAARTSLRLGGEWQRLRPRGTDLDDTLLRATLGVRRQVRRNSAVTADYRYYERDSDQAGGGYRQNTVTLQLQTVF